MDVLLPSVKSIVYTQKSVGCQLLIERKFCSSIFSTTEYFRKLLIYHSTSDQMLSVVLKPFYAVEITQFYVSDLQDKTCKSFAKIILGLQINAIRNWHWHYA